MRDEHVGRIPETTDNDLMGIVTDGDVACRSAAKGSDPGKTLARDTMTKPVYTFHTGESLADAAQTMEDQQVRRLPVVDETGKTI